MKRFYIGVLSVDAELKVLYRQDEVIPLPLKAAEILIVLLEDAGQIVSRDALRQRVWGKAYIEEANITKNIGLLRSTLRVHLDDADPIQTFPKRGYRFTLPVTVADDGAVPTADSQHVRGLGDSRSSMPAALMDGAPVGSSAVLPQSSGRRSRFAPRAWQWSLAILLVLASTAGVLGWVSRQRQRDARPSLAILTLHNLSAEPGQQWLSEALIQTLASDVKADDAMRLVAQDRVSLAERELVLTQTRSYSNAAIRSLGRRLACDYVLSGSYLAVGDQVRIDLEMRDTRESKVVTAFSQTVPQRLLASTVAQAASALRLAAGLPAFSKTQAYLLEIDDDGDQGYRDYLEGIALLEQNQFASARERLSQAVINHPSFPLAHAALASAWNSLGYTQQAGAEATLTLRTAVALSGEQRQAVEAESYQFLTEWPKAIAAYTRLWHEHPDDLDYALGLADSQQRSGDPAGALRTLSSVNMAQSGSAADPRVSMLRASAATAMGDWRSDLFYAGETIRLARAVSSPFMESRGLQAEGKAWRRLGDWDRGMADFREAERISEADGDELGQAVLLTAIGAEEGYRKYPAAIDTLRRAIALHDSIGNRPGVLNAYEELGCAQTDLEDWTGAKDSFHKAIAIADELHAPAAAIGSRLDLVYVALNEDDLASGKLYSDESLRVATAAQNLDGVSSAYLDLGDVSFALGKVTEARGYYQQSMQVLKRIDGGYAIAKLLTHMAVLETAAGDLKAARAWNDQAVAMHSLAGERLDAQRIEEATLQLEEGDAQTVRTTMTALAASSPTARPGAEAWRLAALSSLKLNRLDEAQAAIEKAIAISRNSRNNRTHSIPAAVVAAQIDAARGHALRAVHALDALLHQAEAIGDVPLQASIRLARGRVEAQSAVGGDSLQYRGRRDLESLAAEADHSGLGLIASQARRSSNENPVLMARQDSR